MYGGVEVEVEVEVVEVGLLWIVSLFSLSSLPWCSLLFSPFLLVLHCHFSFLIKYASVAAVVAVLLVASWGAKRTKKRLPGKDINLYKYHSTSSLSPPLPSLPLSSLPFLSPFLPPLPSPASCFLSRFFYLIYISS